MKHSIFDDRESIVRSYCVDAPAIFVGGKGAEIYDGHGRSWIDMMSCAGALNYGHSDPTITAAVSDWLTNGGIWQSLDFHTIEKEEFLKELERLILIPRGMNHRVQFCGPTGTNAVEAAMKLARKVTGRAEIAAFTNGFHGMTLGSLSLTGAKAKRAGAGVPLGLVQRLPYDEYFGVGIDTMDLIEQYYNDLSSGFSPPAAFVVETLQGEGGLNLCSSEWLMRLSKLAVRLGSLLIIDDIQAGVGRCGEFFSFEKLGVMPDMICLSKSIGAGFPLSLLLLRPEHDIWSPGEHNGTFRGNNIAFVAATSALRKYWATIDFSSEVHGKAKYLAKRIDEIVKSAPDMIIKAKGRGMF